jgi:hypothetical protein
MGGAPPGTKISLSEYNWGALDAMNGALAQADALGIFGREGLDLATLWAPPSASQPGAYAFRMFRNYDGEGAAFGDTSLRATSSDPDKLAIYAAERGDKTLTIMIINKSDQDLSSTVALQNASVQESVHVYRYSSAKLDAIEHGIDIKVAGEQISTSSRPIQLRCLNCHHVKILFLRLLGRPAHALGQCRVG